MLDRFKVPLSDLVIIPEASLREVSSALFEKAGLSSEDAASAADVMVTADLRGVESHGVSNKMRGYLKQYLDGDLNPDPHPRVVREMPGTAVMDGDGGLGIVVGARAMQTAIDKARDVGFGVVTMFNSGHLGPIGHFAMLAAQNDMIGMCATTGGGNVLPTFAAEPRLGTSPIAMAAPARNEAPFLFDAATSAVAGNKLGLAARTGAYLMPGWVADDQGVPIPEEVTIKEIGQYHMLPMGSTRELGSHKGYGVSMMVEVLSGLLAGAIPAMVSAASGRGHYFAAYDISAFTDIDIFKDNMDAMLRTLRETPPAPGHDRVLYPGLAESEDEQHRRANGIPLHREVVQWYDDTCAEMSVPPLQRTQPS